MSKEAEKAGSIYQVRFASGLFHHARSRRRDGAPHNGIGDNRAGGGSTPAGNIFDSNLICPEDAPFGVNEMESPMNRFRAPGLVAAWSISIAIGMVVLVVGGHWAYASGETTTKPWMAPVGHRQPRAVDIPQSAMTSPQIIGQEDAAIDRKIKSVCRGC